jgi:tight adherence protein C
VGMLLILGLLLVGSAAALVIRAARLPRIRTDQNIGRIAAYGYAAEATVEPSAHDSLMQRVAAYLGEVVQRSTSSEKRDRLRKMLLAAGFWNTKPATVLGYRVLATGLLGGLIFWAGAKSWGPLVTIIATAYAAGLGWLGPMIALKSRARRRTEGIELQLPELIDLLVVTLEAGVGFTGALHRATERMSGALGDEIRLTLREHNLGLSMDRALANFLDRCDVPSVRSFVRAIIQSEALGVSIGQVMRELASEMRTRRRQIVEEKAQKAPIKILFPLAFLILPALLMIVLYPGLAGLVDTLSNTG